MATYSFKYAVGEEVKAYEGNGLMYDLESFKPKAEYLRSALVVGIEISMESFKYKIFYYDTHKITTVEEKHVFPYYELPETMGYVDVEVVIQDENEPSDQEIQQSL